MLSVEQLVATLVEQLDEAELAGGVAYYALEHVAAGAPLGAPGLDATAPFEALLGFIDREPLANWGHACRYLLVDRETGKEVASIEAQLPPFGPAATRQWRVAYKAPSVPDAAVAVFR